MPIRRLSVRIGLVIRRHREKMKISQERFANEYEIDRTHYSAIERGQQNMTLATLERIAEAFGKVPSQLLREAEKLDLERALKEPHRPPPIRRRKRKVAAD